MSRIMMTGYSRVLTFAGICLWHHDLFYGPGLHSCPYSDHYLSHNLMRRGNKPNSMHVTRFVSVLPHVKLGIITRLTLVSKQGPSLHLPTIIGIRE